jgi:hypothetical protein
VIGSLGFWACALANIQDHTYYVADEIHKSQLSSHSMLQTAQLGTTEPCKDCWNILPTLPRGFAKATWRTAAIPKKKRKKKATGRMNSIRQTQKEANAAVGIIDGF